MPVCFHATGRGNFAFLWVAVLLCLALSSCSAEEAKAPERYARRFLPFDDYWQSESRIPSGSQKSPAMVIWELSSYAPDAEVTPEHQAAADDFVERCERAVEKNGWEDFEKAVADGFEMMAGDRRHYLKTEYILDDRVLDPEHPEFLMYYEAPDRMRLVGFMFYVRSPLERGAQFGGPLTMWHYHVWSHTGCLVQGMYPVGTPAEDGRCPEGLVPTWRSPEMIHVWLIDHPVGRFATSMLLKPKVARKALAEREQALLERDSGSTRK